MEVAGEDFPLTCGQRSLVNRLKTEPELARPLQRIYRLAEEFNYSTFTEALRHTTAVHPALRLRLVSKDGQWRQCFPGQTAKISMEKAGGITRRLRSIYAGLLIAEERKHTLDLTKEPPVKAMVIKVSGKYLLSLCIDHIAVDGLAFDLFEKELLRYYEQIESGVFVPPAPSPAFLSYVLNEQKTQCNEKGNLMYWQNQLRDAEGIRFANLQRDSVPAEKFKYDLSGLGFKYFMNFCRSHNCTPFTVIVAVNLLLLSEMRNLFDIVLSIPFSNRIHMEERSIIGTIMVPLYVSFKILANEPKRDFLIRIKKQLLNGMMHKQYDFPALAKILKSDINPQKLQIGFFNSCNLMVDNDSINYPNKIFTERMEDKSANTPKVPGKSFRLEGIQTGSGILFTILWDRSYWPITAGDLRSKFLDTLDKICE